MNRLYFSAASTAAFLMLNPLTVQAADAVVEIDPGLYAYTSTLSVGGFEQMNDQYEYCLTPDLTKKTMPELVEEITAGGNCDVNNAQVGGGQGSADINCRFPEMGFSSTGKITATYSKTDYNAITTARINESGAEIKANVKATRIGDCPPGWTPPPGISHK